MDGSKELRADSKSYYKCKYGVHLKTHADRAAFLAKKKAEQKAQTAARKAAREASEEYKARRRFYARRYYYRDLYNVDLKTPEDIEAFHAEMKINPRAPNKQALAERREIQRIQYFNRRYNLNLKTNAAVLKFKAQNSAARAERNRAILSANLAKGRAVLSQRAAERRAQREVERAQRAAEREAKREAREAEREAARAKRAAEKAAKLELERALREARRRAALAKRPRPLTRAERYAAMTPLEREADRLRQRIGYIKRHFGVALQTKEECDAFHAKLKRDQLTAMHKARRKQATEKRIHAALASRYKTKEAREAAANMPSQDIAKHLAAFLKSGGKVTSLDYTEEGDLQ